jgi:AIR synthase related protein, N-terminal domain
MSAPPLLDLATAYRQVLAGRAWPAEAVRRVRDLLILQQGSMALVVACDSNASIGSKPADHLQQDPAITGYSAAKVPLMEVIAAGAVPLILVDNLCCEMEPTGRRILEGVAEAVAESNAGMVVTGSDETNMPTVQTGVGITVIGVARSAELRLGTARAGDAVACIGTPKNGTSVPYREGDPEIASPAALGAVSRSGLVSELLPVGSRGVRYEVEQLASTAGHVVAFDESPGIDVELSAGSSTCFLAAVAPANLRALSEVTSLPIHTVARLS